MATAAFQQAKSAAHAGMAATNEWGDQANWSDPAELLSGVPPVDAFDLDLLPGKSRPWVEDICDRMQVPADFVAVPTMVQAGAITGRQVGIRPKRADDWLVIPNLYGGVIGRPGLLKTPCLREALAPIHALEADARGEHAEAMREHEAAMKVYKVASRIADKNIEKTLKGDPTAKKTLIKKLTESEANRTSASTDRLLRR
jgi:hypothetical protein